MSDQHLPECYCARPSQFAKPCICDRLRQAEQRAWAEFLDKSQREDVYDRGYAAGLSAARDVVAALPHDPDCRSYRGGTCSCPWREYVLAAIDAIKEEP